MDSPPLSKYRVRPRTLPIIMLSLFIALAVAVGTIKHLFSNYRTNLPRLSRTRRSLIYWSPQKTGSGSLRHWLMRLAEDMDVPYIPKLSYTYAKEMDWHEMADKQKNETCSFVAAHIHINSVQDRPHEGTLGAVITTARKARDTLASKHFHRTSQDLERDLEKLRDRTSQESRIWFLYFHDLDPCEQLNYYDGKQGCEEDEGLLVQRARSIAERIDCVVDTDDAGEDLNALCELMRVEKCPPPLYVNQAGNSMYTELFAIEHITPPMQRVLRVTEILRTELMKRRCRFLTDGSGLSTPGLEEPKWPFAGCRSAS